MTTYSKQRFNGYVSINTKCILTSLSRSLFSWTLLTEPQFSEVATSNLLSNSEIWANHRHRLAGNARPLAGTVACPFTDMAGRDLPRRFTDTASWDFPHRLRADLLPNFLDILSRLSCHCPRSTRSLDPGSRPYLVI